MRNTILALLALATTALGQTRVLFFGDSHIYGTGTTPSTMVNSFPAQTGAILGAGYTIIKQGTKGAAVMDVDPASRVLTFNFANMAQVAPDVVVIMGGTNDADPDVWAWGWFTDAYTGQATSRFLWDYAQLVDGFRSLPTHPRVIICTPPPLNPAKTDPTYVAGLAQVVPLVHQLATQRAVEFVDVNAAIVEAMGWGIVCYSPAEGFHCNNTGAHIMAQLTAAKILAP